MSLAGLGSGPLNPLRPVHTGVLFSVAKTDAVSIYVRRFVLHWFALALPKGGGSAWLTFMGNVPFQAGRHTLKCAAM